MPPASPRVRAYLACSLDGFIAGPDDDLSWLPGPSPEDGPSTGIGFDDILDVSGAMLMGRRTYDVVGAMGAWPYGDLPVLVATTRPLPTDRATVRPVTGDIVSLVAQAREAAGTDDVYLDGGQLIRQALDAGLLDELIITYVPILLADGIPLFRGLTTRRALTFTASHRFGANMMQVVVSLS